MLGMYDCMKTKRVSLSIKEWILAFTAASIFAQSAFALHPELEALLSSTNRHVPGQAPIPLKNIPLAQWTIWDVIGGNPSSGFGEISSSKNQGHGNVFQDRFTKIDAKLSEIQLDPESRVVLRKLGELLRQGHEALESEAKYAELRSKYQVRYTEGFTRSQSTTPIADVGNKIKDSNGPGIKQIMSVGLISYGASYFISKYLWHNRFGLRDQHEQIGFKKFLESAVGQFSFQSLLIIAPLISANLVITSRMLKTAWAQNHPLKGLFLASLISGVLSNRYLKGIEVTAKYKQGVRDCGYTQERLNLLELEWAHRKSAQDKMEAESKAAEEKKIAGAKIASEGKKTPSAKAPSAAHQGTEAKRLAEAVAPNPVVPAPSQKDTVPPKQPLQVQAPTAKNNKVAPVAAATAQTKPTVDAKAEIPVKADPLQGLASELMMFRSRALACERLIQDDFWTTAKAFVGGVTSLKDWEEDVGKIVWGAVKFGAAYKISKGIKDLIIASSTLLEKQQRFTDLGKSLQNALFNRAVYESKLDQSIMYNVAKTMNVGRHNIKLPSIGLTLNRTKDALYHKPMAKISGALLSRIQLPGSGTLSPTWITSFIRTIFGKYTSIIFDSVMLAFTFAGIEILELEKTMPHYYQTHFNYSLGERLQREWANVLQKAKQFQDLDAKSYDPEKASQSLQEVTKELVAHDEIWSQYRNAEIHARLNWEEETIVQEIASHQKRDFMTKNYFDLLERNPNAPNWMLKRDPEFIKNGGNSYLKWRKDITEPVQLDQEMTSMRELHTLLQLEAVKQGKTPYQLFYEKRQESRDRVKELQEVRLKNLKGLVQETYVGRRRGGYVTRADEQARNAGPYLYRSFASPGNLKDSYSEEARLILLNWTRYLESRPEKSESPEAMAFIQGIRNNEANLTDSSKDWTKIEELVNLIENASYISEEHILNAPSLKSETTQDFPLKLKSVRLSLLTRLMSRKVYRLMRLLENNQKAYELKLAALDLTKNLDAGLSEKTRDAIINNQADSKMINLIVGTASTGIVYSLPPETAGSQTTESNTSSGETTFGNAAAALLKTKPNTNIPLLDDKTTKALSLADELIGIKKGN